jgi:hypothetical protein
MKKTLFTFLIFITFQAHATWDNSGLIGEWESYKYGYSHQYQKLIINKDYSGTFLYIRGDSEGELVKFKKSDLKFFEGYAVLDIDTNIKLLLSAWGTRATNNTKRLLGQMFIYMMEGDEIKLINSEPINYYSATDEGFDEFSKKVKDVQSKNH